ncbi:hypothetical protein ANRL1_03135 [Anaerolineae bacterium]|nr:hypothetical protein ANRL1_03135 [Anaerolineae bacterium]
MSKQIELLSPIAQVITEPLPSAPRLDTLERRVVALLDNTKQNTNIFMERVERELVERFGVERVQRIRKFDSAKPAAGLDDLVRGADAIINGIGD